MCEMLTTAAGRRGVACGTKREDGRRVLTDQQVRPVAGVSQGRAQERKSGPVTGGRTVGKRIKINCKLGVDLMTRGRHHAQGYDLRKKVGKKA